MWWSFVMWISIEPERNTAHTIPSHQNIFCGRTSAVDNTSKNSTTQRCPPKERNSGRFDDRNPGLNLSQRETSSAMVSLQHYSRMLYYFSRVQFHFFLSEMILNCAKIVQHSWIKPLTVWTFGRSITPQQHLISLLPLWSVIYALL